MQWWDRLWNFWRFRIRNTPQANSSKEDNVNGIQEFPGALRQLSAPEPAKEPAKEPAPSSSYRDAQDYIFSHWAPSPPILEKLLPNDWTSSPLLAEDCPVGVTVDENAPQLIRWQHRSFFVVGSPPRAIQTLQQQVPRFFQSDFPFLVWCPVCEVPQQTSVLGWDNGRVLLTLRCAHGVYYRGKEDRGILELAQWSWRWYTQQAWQDRWAKTTFRPTVMPETFEDATQWADWRRDPVESVLLKGCPMVARWPE